MTAIDRLRQARMNPDYCKREEDNMMAMNYEKIKNDPKVVVKIKKTEPYYKSASDCRNYFKNLLQH